MTNLKIVHLLSSNARLEPGRLGAVATVALGLIENSEANNQSYVCIPRKDGEQVQDTDKTRFIRISVVLNSLQKVICMIHPAFRDYLYIKAAAKEINDIEADGLIVHNRPGYIEKFKQYLNPDIKLILYEHNNNIAHMFSRRKGKQILSKLDGVICVSNSCLNIDILEKHSEFKKKAYMVHNGVDTSFFNPDIKNVDSINRLKSKYEISDKTVILFTGAIRERKGLHFLIDAFSEVVSKYDDVVLVIAGGSALNEKATDKYARDIYSKVESLNGKIILLDYVPHDQINNIYMMADIYCAPSKWEEAFGLVFVEAMSCGLPVISTIRGGIPEIVKDEITGYLVNDIENNVSELTEKLSKLIEDDSLRHEFGKKGRERVINEFDWKVCSKRYDEVIKDIVKGSIS